MMNYSDRTAPAAGEIALGLYDASCALVTRANKLADDLDHLRNRLGGPRLREVPVNNVGEAPMPGSIADVLALLGDSLGHAENTLGIIGRLV